MFGRNLGTQRQAQLALLILFYVSRWRSRVLRSAPSQSGTRSGRLELASLFTLWGTMWCNADAPSQAPGDEGFVVFCGRSHGERWHHAVADLQLIAECLFEKKDSKIVKIVHRQSFGRRPSWRRRTRKNEAVNQAEKSGSS